MANPSIGVHGSGTGNNRELAALRAPAPGRDAVGVVWLSEVAIYRVLREGPRWARLPPHSPGGAEPLMPSRQSPSYCCPAAKHRFTAG